VSEEEQLRQLKEAQVEALLAKPYVVGVGTGFRTQSGELTDELCIVVMVRTKLPAGGLPVEARIPAEIEGVPTDVLEVGELWALQTRQARSERWRPAPGGVSVGHYQASAGTLGGVVLDRATGARLILSNNHVLANWNEGRVGEPIVQPGPADGGRVPEDTIAHLERFCPIGFGTSPAACPVARGVASTANALAGWVGSQHRLQAVQIAPATRNVVDAAVARPVDDGDVADEILGIGVLQGSRPAALGMPVLKSGSTSQVNTGVVIVTHATVLINYGPGKLTRFEDQIVTSPMSESGDSGSLLVARDSLQAVGLLFAGSPQVTVHNRIETVLEALQVSIGTAGASAAEMRVALARARAVRRAHEAELLGKAHVVGVATGVRQKEGRSTGEVALVVVVEKKVPRAQLASQDAIPAQIEGVPVDVQVAETR
jgi:hypothetical protein